MKNVILILIIVFNFSCISAQEITLKKGKKINKVNKGTYYKTDETLLNKYLGIWTIDLKGKTFKFEILKKKTEVQGIFIDRIIAKYYFNKNSKVYENKEIFKSSAKEYGLDILEKNILFFRFWDYDYKKYGNLKFEILEKGKASFKLQEAYNPWSKKKGFSIPTEMILMKNK